MVSKFVFSRNDGLRPLLNIPHGFGLTEEKTQRENLHQPFEKFVDQLRASNQIFGQIEILQENLSRGRVVFSALNMDGERIVIKWFNTDAPLTFNFIGSMDMERFMHGTVATKLGFLIPKLKFECGTAVAVEFVRGKSLSEYLNTSHQKQNVLLIVKTLLGYLKTFYQITEDGELSAQLFNKAVLREYNYMRQVSQPPSYNELFGFLTLKINLMEKYDFFLKKAGKIFSLRLSPWKKTLCILDLDTQNILFNEETKKAWIVDTEDTYSGTFVCDLAWFSSRLYLSANPLQTFMNCNEFFVQFIDELDTEDSKSSIDLYQALLGSYLVLGLMNPQLIDIRDRKKINTADILSIIEILEIGKS